MSYLYICKSIYKNELKFLEKEIPLEKIKEAASKAKKGLGINIKGSQIKETKLIKIYLTTIKGAARLIFLLMINKEIYIPVILRLKKDKLIGENITIKNKFFENLLSKNLDLIFEDLKNNEYIKYQL
jgi:hypothetical protein